MTKFCLDITTREGHAWNNIKKSPRETVQCIVWQSEFLKESLDTRLRITTGGNHIIGLGRNPVQSTGPLGPIPVYLQWKNKLCCQSNWEIFDNTRLSVKWAEFEGIGFESKDTIGLVDEEYPNVKGHYSDCYQIWQLNRQVLFEL